MDPLLGLFSNFWIARPRIVFCVVWFVLVGFWAFHGSVLLLIFCGEFDPGSG